jgi:polyphosphate kinase
VLDFNERVLAQARRSEVPLLERLRYITIMSSNMDEFFEVRLPDYLAQARARTTPGARQALDRLAARAHALIDEQYALFNDEVMPALAEHGIHVLNHAQRNPAQRRWVAECFESQVRPLLVPVALDPAHPFPLVANKSLNFILQLAPVQPPTAKARHRVAADQTGGRGNAGAAALAGAVVIIKVPRSLPRVMRVPDRLMPSGQQGFVLLTSVIRAHLADLLPGQTVQSFSQFRVTRDSDLEVDEDDLTNLRQALRTGLTTRHYGQAIRLEVVRTCPPALSALLLRQFHLPLAALYLVNGPVNLVRLNQLIDQVHANALRFPAFEPVWPAACGPREGSLFARLRQGDVLLHHPFESFEPVVQLLREAAHDPEVVAIKQTVYRTGSESVLMDLLIEAVKRGKEVLVVLELQARFDEEANINWAERLEAVGAQVVYGAVGLKTHAKLLLVTRRERPARTGRAAGTGHGAPSLRRYAHLSTGNYNPGTARQYTDLGLLTADPAFTADIDRLFFSLASLTPIGPLQHLVVAPEQLHPRLLQQLQQVAAAARSGRPARVVLKTNALTEPALIQALLAAARAGARIDLIVRGACMLRPGELGEHDGADRIRVRSVVGRFLEHTRIFYFSWGPAANDEVLYLSSADWMSRNMFRRVEVAWPVRDPVLRQRVIDEGLVPYLLDRQDAWEMQTTGRYQAADGAGPGAQTALLAHVGSVAKGAAAARAAAAKAKTTATAAAAAKGAGTNSSSIKAAAAAT